VYSSGLKTPESPYIASFASKHRIMSLLCPIRCSIHACKSMMNCHLGFGSLLLLKDLMVLDRLLYCCAVDVEGPALEIA
jgi:hypothetical protein